VRPTPRLLGITAALLLGACSRNREGAAAPTANGQLYEANVTVLEAPGKPAMLCWNVNLSLPPQCGDMVTAGWSWDDVEGEQRASGVTWGSYHVVGHYDGKVFTVVEAGAPQPGDPPREDTEITSPCEPPAGGWTAPDPARTRPTDMEAVTTQVRAAADHAGLWIVYLDGSPGEGEAAPGRVLLNVAFTGDLERHCAELAELWGGPLCLVQHTRSLAQLEEIQSALTTEAKQLGMLSASTDEVGNRVVVDVTLAEAADQAAMDERYGKGAVRLTSALRPAG
jgi:hypothetical protein